MPLPISRLVTTHHSSLYLCEWWKGVPCQLTSMSNYSRDISEDPMYDMFVQYMCMCSVCNLFVCAVSVFEQYGAPLLRLDDKPLVAELCFSDLFAAANANLPLLIKNHGTDKQSRMTSTGGGRINGSFRPCKIDPSTYVQHTAHTHYAVYPSPTMQQSIDRTNHPTINPINHHSARIHKTTDYSRSIHL